MKTAKLLHNPGAGKETYSRIELIALIESVGITCHYASTKKKSWKEFDPDHDFLIVASGDGTVRKVAKELLNRRLIDKRYPIALLPLGTANNIAKTLGIEGDAQLIIQSWQYSPLKPFDAGLIHGLGQPHFFLEGYGYGLFPELITEMKKLDRESIATPEAELKTALLVLHDLVLTYSGQPCEVEIDGVRYSDNYLLVEVVNTRSIGPNLVLAPNADPGDGWLEVMLIAEHQRELLASYVQALIHNADTPLGIEAIRAKSIRIRWESPLLHIDDELITIKKPKELTIEPQVGIFEFMGAKSTAL